MRKIILSTDWWTDCDDAVAVRVIAHGQKSGLWQLCGVVINACMDYSVRSLRGFLTHEGLGGAPVSIDRRATDFGGRPSYQKNLAEKLGGDFTEADAGDPVEMLRTVLAGCADGEMEIIEIGYPQCLAALLQSDPDGISPLSGRELVQKKVARLWMMAGNYEHEEDGRENNFARNARSARGGSIVCRDWPTPITFLGWEAANTVISGGNLPAEDPLAGILADHGSAKGRSSWDPLTVYMAMCGSPDAAGMDEIRGRVTVDAETGHNSFTRDGAGPHAYIQKRHEDRWYEDRLNGML